MDATEVGKVSVIGVNEHTQCNEYFAAGQREIELASLEARLKAWAALYERAVDADHEVRMQRVVIPTGQPVPPNPYTARLKMLIGLGEPLAGELASFQKCGAVVWGAASFKDAFAEAVEDDRAADSLAARPPLDFDKLTAQIKPPPKEWFDREHQLDAEGREW